MSVGQSRTGRKQAKPKKPKKPEWVEYLNGLTGREFARVAGAWLLVAVVVAVAAWWYAAPRWPVLPQFPTVDWWLIGLTVAFLVELRVIWRALFPRVPPEPVWWEEHTMLRAMSHAGILKSLTSDDGVPLVLKRVSGPVTNPGGLSVAHRLPHVPGLYAGEVSRRQDALAAALGVPTSRFHVTEHEGRGDQIRCTLTPPPFTPATREPGWIYGKRPISEPFIYAVDTQTGRDVPMPLFNKKGRFIGAGALVAGMSGYGKSNLLRLVFAYARSLDGGLLWMADGKAKRGEDFERARHTADRSVCQIDRDAKTRYLAFVEALRAEVDRRYSEGGSHPPLIAVFDEYAALRRMIGKGTQELADHDEAVEDIAQRCRDASIFLVFATQHPSVDAIPSAIRDQCSVRLSFYQPTGRGLKMVFDEEPAKGDRPPMIPGRALVEVDGVLTHVLVDHLDDGPWAAWCEAQPTRGGPQDAPAVDAAPQDAPMTAESEYRRIVTQDMPVTALWEALSPDLPLSVRRGSAAAFARWELEGIGVTEENGLRYRTETGSWVRPIPTFMPTAVL